MHGDSTICTDTRRDSEKNFYVHSSPNLFATPQSYRIRPYLLPTVLVEELEHLGGAGVQLMSELTTIQAPYFQLGLVSHSCDVMLALFAQGSNYPLEFAEVGHVFGRRAFLVSRRPNAPLPIVSNKLVR